MARNRVSHRPHKQLAVHLTLDQVILRAVIHDEGELEVVIADRARGGRAEPEGLRGGVVGERVWIGLGTWLFVGRPMRAARQLEMALASAPMGIAIFSYDAIAATPEALEALRPLGGAGAVE